jgi:hypothetical protein
MGSYLAKYVDHVFYRWDRNHMIRVHPGVEPCPFMGGKAFRTHEKVCEGLRESVDRHVNGEVDRTNLLGTNTLAAGMFPDLGANLLGVSAHTHRLTRQVTNAMIPPNVKFLLTPEEDVAFCGMLRVATGGVVDIKPQINIWWIQVLARFMGIGALDINQAQDLLKLQWNMLFKSIFIPNALGCVQGSTVKHMNKWLEYVIDATGCSRLNAIYVMDVLVFAGGLSVPMLIKTALEMQHYAKRDSIDAFIYECARHNPPVGSYPVREKDGTLVFFSLLAALKDPKVWGSDADDFRVRDLADYRDSFIGFAEPAISSGNNRLDDRVCPGKGMTMDILRACVAAMLDVSAEPVVGWTGRPATNANNC